jgi:hypothetical protein
VDAADDFCPVSGAAVGEVVTVNRCYHGVTQLERLDHVGNILHLFLLKRERFTRCDIAKLAAAGANIATNQEGSCAVSPTFGTVRTERALTDGVTALFGNKANHLYGVFAKRHCYSQPLGFALILYFHWKSVF